MTVKTGLDKKAILQLLEEHAGSIKNFGVANLGLFGSAVRDEQTSESDLDLLVEFIEGKKSYDNFIKLAFYLENLLGQKVDLITRKSLTSRVEKSINKEIEYVSFNS